MDPNMANKNRDNGLLLSCCNNSNLDVIKYLIEERKMDPNVKNLNGNNGLHLATLNVNSFQLIRYLLEE